MIDIAEITAVSDLNIFSLIFNSWTPLNFRILALSSSEKSPSGPIITHVGLSVTFFKSILVFSEFRSVKIKSTLLLFKKSSNDFGSSISGTLILFDCSDASIITFSNRS